MSERITITIETKTPDFQRAPNREIVRLVREAASRLENGLEHRPLRDADGNIVGWITIEPLANC